MPQYDFQHPKTGEIKELILRMNEPHVYIDKEGVEWIRIFAVPQASIDSKFNAWSVNKFVEKTSKPDTVGAMWDRARDASEIRAKDAGGKDPLKEKSLKEYSKLRKGRPYIPKIE